MCNTYFAMIEPYTYRSVSRKNVGMDTFTSNLVWTVRKNEENEQRENEYSEREREREREKQFMIDKSLHNQNWTLKCFQDFLLQKEERKKRERNKERRKKERDVFRTPEFEIS